MYQLLFAPRITLETLIIRTSAVTAFLLLHIILVIGPLCRLDKRFLPILYNRRHMGVSMFLIALLHGVFAAIQYHGGGNENVLVSIFTSNTHYQRISAFPFQVLGFYALLILFIMAATSHDFWLKNLGPRVWKSIHMCVYLAYGLLIAHVLLGSLQNEEAPEYTFLLLGGFVLIAGLHLTAGIRENMRLLAKKKLKKEGFVQVCEPDNIPENRAKTFNIEGQNIAVYRYDGKVSAIHNVCKHQQGPLGEGKIVDGCITCPWHGYQYLPGNGQSPPPFTEKVHTYQVRIEEGFIWINPKPLPEGTETEPAQIN